MRRIFSAAGLVRVFFGLPSSVRADDAQVQRGVAVYAAQKCSLCHAIAGVGKTHALDGVGAKLSAADIRQWLVDPKAAALKAKSVAKPAMRDYSKLPPADIDALVAYMKSLTAK
jgi:mono/diheme cytochrome c family protein